jgi:hypothetical protein
MNIKKRLFLTITLITSALCSFFTLDAQLQFVKPLQDVQIFNYHVKLVADALGKKFIIKDQHSSERAIAEVLSAHIGQAIGLPINDVQFVDLQDYPSESSTIIRTLHSIVPGAEVYQQPDIANVISIQGGLINPTNFKTLTSIMKLCKMMAYDLFTNNFDRHNGNLFFDKISQEFYAIDMDYAFASITCTYPSFLLNVQYSMPFNTHTFLKEYQGTDKKLSAKKLLALNEIKNTLKTLLDSYPPRRLYKEWMDLAAQINRTYTIEEKARIAATLTQHYYMIKLLHAKLNILTKNSSSFSKDSAVVLAGEKIIQIEQIMADIHRQSISLYNNMRYKMYNAYINFYQKHLAAKNIA